MPDAYDAIEHAAEALDARRRYSERNRLVLLTVHGLVGSFAGLFLLHDGTPKTYQRLVGTTTAANLPLAITPLVGGLLLLIGLAAGRRLRVEATGMALMLGWDLAMSVVFIVGRTSDPTQATYPIAVYIGLAAMMTAHLTTLITFVRSKR